MITPVTTVTKKYAYIKNEVIFDIKNNDNGDVCVKEINNITSPQFVAISSKGVSTTYYFSNFIENGDTYDGTKFMKTIHNYDGEEEISADSKTFSEYFESLCEDEIANVIINNYTLSYTNFVEKPEKLGVPRYMLKLHNSDDYTLEGIHAIDFTEEYYNNAKANKVKELIFNCGKSTANQYGYKLVAPSGITEIKIEILEEEP